MKNTYINNQKNKKQIKQYLDNIIRFRREQINLFQENLIYPLRRNIEIVRDVRKGKLSFEYLKKHIIEINKHLKGLFKDSEGIK